jgi:hypothetical protein
MFLLVHNNCTGGFVVTFPYVCSMCPGASTPQPLLPVFKMTSTGFSVLYLYIRRKYINCILSLLLPLFPAVSVLLLMWLVLHFRLLLSVHCSVGSCLGSLPVTVFYFNPFTLYHSTVFNEFFCVLLLFKCGAFQDCSLSVILFFSPSSLNLL